MRVVYSCQRGQDHIANYLKIKGVRQAESDQIRAGQKVAVLEKEIAEWQQRYQEKSAELQKLAAENARYRMVVQAAGGREHLPV